MDLPKNRPFSLESAWVVFGLLLGMGLLAFSPGLSNPFLFDDIPILAENTWLTWDHLPSFFRSFAHTSGLTFPGYRPLLMASFVVENQLFGLHPEVFRLTNLFLHVAVAFLLFQLTRELVFQKLKNPSTWAFLVALIFLLHPIQTNVISLIWKRSDLFVGLGLLGCLWSFSRAIKPTSHLKLSWIFAGNGFAVLAFLSKENAMILPLLLGVVDLFFWRPKLNFKKRVALYAPILFLTFSYAWIFWIAMPEVLRPFKLSGMNALPPSLRLSPLEYFGMQVSAWLKYVQLMFWPNPLAVFHAIPKFSSWWQMSFLGGAVLFGAGALAIKIFFRIHRVLAWAVLWFGLLLLPSSSLIPLALPFDEDRLYLPLMGTAWGLVYLLYLGHELAKQRAWPWLARLSWAMPLLVCLVYLPASWLRLHEWKDGVTLWSGNVEAYPNDPRPWVQLGAAWAKERGELDRSSQAFFQAISLEPNYGAAHFFFGESLLSLHETNKAEAALFHALRLESYRPRALDYLGVIRTQQSRPALGMVNFVQSLNFDRSDPLIYRNLALLLDGHGQTKASLNILMKGWILSPHDPETNIRVADHLIKQGGRELAQPFLDRAYAKVPEDPRVKALRGRSQGKYNVE